MIDRAVSGRQLAAVRLTSGISILRVRRYSGTTPAAGISGAVTPNVSFRALDTDTKKWGHEKMGVAGDVERMYHARQFEALSVPGTTFLAWYSERRSLPARRAGPRLPYQTDEQLSVGDIVNLSPRAGTGKSAHPVVRPGKAGAFSWDIEPVRQNVAPELKFFLL